VADIVTQVNSSIDCLQQEFNIIAHNLANVSTAGYKRRCNAFSKSLMEQQAQTNTGPTGDVALETTFDFSQGSITETGRTLDFALYGKGFFVIETPQGPLYTRNGMFQINQNGQIVDCEGRTVAGKSGPISIPAGTGLSQLNVSSNGSISAGGTVVGEFKLSDFGDDRDKLVPVGGNCFAMPDNTRPTPAENIVVKQGYLEASNVKMVEELVDMIMVSRLYEANMKFISAGQDISSSIIGVAMA
jgi:flagellar basal-body rod protein FlgF